MKSVEALGTFPSGWPSGRLSKAGQLTAKSRCALFGLSLDGAQKFHGC